MHGTRLPLALVPWKHRIEAAKRDAPSCWNAIRYRRVNIVMQRLRTQATALLSPRMGSQLIACALLVSGCLKLHATLLRDSLSDAGLIEYLLVATAWIEIAWALEWVIRSRPTRSLWQATFVLACVNSACMLIGPKAFGIKPSWLASDQHEKTIQIVSSLLVFMGLMLNRGSWKSTSESPSLSTWRWGLLTVLMLSFGYPWHVMTSTSGPLRAHLGFQKQQLELRSSQPLEKEHNGDWRIHLGELPPGTDRTFNLDVRNAGMRSIKLIGYWTACSCTTMEGFPAEVSPSETGALQVMFKSPVLPGNYHFPIDLYSDQIDKPALRLTLVCTINNELPEP